MLLKGWYQTALVTIALAEMPGWIGSYSLQQLKANAPSPEERLLVKPNNPLIKNFRIRNINKSAWQKDLNVLKFRR